MAELKLLPRKAFELTLDDNSKVKGRFDTYALALYDQSTAGKQLTRIFSLTAILLAAVKSGTDKDACKWIDDLGGVDDPRVLELIEHLAGKEEKKTEDQSASVNSNESQPVSE